MLSVCNYQTTEEVRVRKLKGPMWPRALSGHNKRHHCFCGKGLDVALHVTESCEVVAVCGFPVLLCVYINVSASRSVCGLFDKYFDSVCCISPR